MTTSNIKTQKLSRAVNRSMISAKIKKLEDLLHNPDSLSEPSIYTKEELCYTQAEIKQIINSLWKDYLANM